MTGMVCYFKSKDFSGVVLFFAICLSVATPSAQKLHGFVNIDCGSSVSRYNDSQTSLTWEDDGNYTLTGLKGVVPSPVNSSLDNYQALQSFRYFPGHRNKYCYELPLTTGNISFLIRAMFLHGNSSELVLPIKFGVHVNATLWISVEYGLEDNLMTPQMWEAIFYSPGKMAYVCLVPIQGVPFISSLELRQFDPEGIMYAFNNRESLFFTNLLRWNIGVSADAPTVRYPDDSYDRLWMNPGDNFQVDNINASLPTNVSTGPQVNNVPLKVMMDASTGGQGSICSGGQLNLPLTGTGGYVYAFFYFEALNAIALDNSGNLVLEVLLGEWESQPFNVTTRPSVKKEYLIVQTDSVMLIIFSESSDYSTCLNALEWYQENFFNSTTTSADNAILISYLKSIFDMTDWQGDPCTPVPYDWITCSTHFAPFTNVESITLSKLQNTARLIDTPIDFSTLDTSELLSLSMTYSHVDDTTFNFLIENVTFGSFAFNALNMSHNDISVLPANATIWESKTEITTLDLSYNRFSQVPSFVDLPFSSTLQILNLSGNSITSFPNSWGNSSSGLMNLNVIDFSHNKLTDEISSNSSNSLTELVLRNNLSLQELYISDNNFRGEFPSPLYFSTLSFPNLKTLDIKQNRITGLLDLSIWEQSIKASIGNSSSVYPLFSFQNNDITDIKPSAQVLQSTIDFLIKNQPHFNDTGVLLGGNPYCKGAESFTQRYLCRSSVNDIVLADKKKTNSIALIIATTLGGSVVLLLCGILFVIIWRLQKKVYALQDIQQALADREVQPPFYSYRDLKLATRDFHPDNKLGSGAFGAVYKGVLSEERTIAVKKLFDSQGEQVLHEFLNEVVLITGIKHKNLVQLQGCCIKDNQRILVYEYVEKGNLAQALWGKHTREQMNWEHRFNICRGIAKGLAYLHEELQPRIIHRDIKPANILLDNHFNAKIADFGLAKPFWEEDTQAQFTHVAGTKGYFAPEYVLDGNLTVKADVYSFGIVVLEIVSGRMCIDVKRSPDEVSLKSWAENLQKKGRLLDLVQLELKNNCPETEVLKVINMALTCVRTDPNLRPSMAQISSILSRNVELTNYTLDDTNQGVDQSHDEEENLSLSTGREFGADESEVPFLRSQSMPASASRSHTSGGMSSIELSSSYALE